MLFRQFPPIRLEIPEVPGAAAFSLPLEERGLFHGEIKPPTLIMATLRALKRYKPDSRDAPAQWLLEIEGDAQALDDLRIEVANVEGLRWHDERWWRFPDKVGPMEEVASAEAEAALWRRCAAAVLGDLSGEAIDEALQRLERHYQDQEAKAKNENEARAHKQAEHISHLPAWPFWLGVWWLAYRTIDGAEGAWSEFGTDRDWRTLVDFGSYVEGLFDFEHKPKAALLERCARQKGILQGVKLGGSGDYEDIDPRHISDESFSIPVDCESASASGIVWRGLRVDREKLWEIAPPPAVLLMNEVRELWRWHEARAVAKGLETFGQAISLAANQKMIDAGLEVLSRAIATACDQCLINGGLDALGRAIFLAAHRGMLDSGLKALELGIEASLKVARGNKSGWLADRLGSLDAPLTPSKARDLAAEWLCLEGKPIGEDEIKQEAERIKALRRSFNRGPKKQVGAK